MSLDKLVETIWTSFVILFFFLPVGLGPFLDCLATPSAMAGAYKINETGYLRVRSEFL